jgi:hypothetical protein
MQDKPIIQDLETLASKAMADLKKYLDIRRPTKVQSEKAKENLKIINLYLLKLKAEALPVDSYRTE